MLGYYLLKIVASDGVLHDNQKAEYLIADKGCGSHQIVDEATNKWFKVVFPPRANAINPREYDKELYKRRHFVEYFFLKIKRFRSISTRYTKNIANFRAFLAIASFLIYSESIWRHYLIKLRDINFKLFGIFLALPYCESENHNLALNMEHR